MSTADLCREGVLCETCGVALDGEAPGHPRRCDDCPPLSPPSTKIIDLMAALKASLQAERDKDGAA